jgi:ABC-2 type transport system ATP-binding protein
MLEQLNQIPSANETSLTPTALEVRNLNKTYGGKKAVDDVSLAVLKGEIFGILGPNGAGKTTTLEIIEGLRSPDSNPSTSIRVDSLNVLNSKDRAELRHRIGLQLQTSALFDELTVRENLEMLAMLYRNSVSVIQLLKDYDLEEKAKARLDTLSGGQKQRVVLAASLINNPSVLFLDEPTTALDPQARHNIWEIVQQQRQTGKTIILTTHYMEEAEKLCDRVAIMDNARIVALGTPAQLIQRYASAQRITCRFENGGLKEEVIKALPAIEKLFPISGGYNIYTGDLTVTLPALLHVAQSHNAPLLEIVTQSPSLEDVFLNLTGKALRD